MSQLSGCFIKDLDSSSALSDRVIAQKCRKIKVIGTEFHILSDGKPVIIIGFQDPLRLVRPASDQTDMGVDKEVDLIL